jgi:voltage-gated potassium channel
MGMKVSQRVWQVLEPSESATPLAKAVVLGIQVLILLNITSVVLESVAGIRASYGPALRVFDAASVLAFTVEYVLRVYSCTAAERFARPVTGRLRFALTPLAVLDLLCILPFYLPFTGVDLRFLRIFRVLRFARIGKLARYSRALRTLGRAVVEKKEELLVSFLVVLALLVVSSCLMYETERHVQPDAFPSIPATMWWAAVTLTTVGYGDVYPATALGKFLTSIIAILGVGVFTLPAAIIAAGLIEQIHERREGPPRCPHCHRQLV